MCTIKCTLELATEGVWCNTPYDLWNPSSNGFQRRGRGKTEKHGNWNTLDPQPFGKPADVSKVIQKFKAPVTQSPSSHRWNTNQQFTFCNTLPAIARVASHAAAAEAGSVVPALCMHRALVSVVGTRLARVRVVAEDCFPKHNDTLVSTLIPWALVPFSSAGSLALLGKPRVQTHHNTLKSITWNCLATDVPPSPKPLRQRGLQGAEESKRGVLKICCDPATWTTVTQQHACNGVPTT